MTRFLILMALVYLGVYLAARGVAQLRGRLGEVVTEPTMSRGSVNSELVACSACGVHVPRARALGERDDAARSGSTESRFYCSEDCRMAGPGPQAMRTRSA